MLPDAHHNPGSGITGLLEPFIERDPARLGGVPVFRGTRVPVKSLFDHLEAGDPLDIFLSDFPGVTREQAQAVIKELMRIDKEGRVSRFP